MSKSRRIPQAIANTRQAGTCDDCDVDFEASTVPPTPPYCQSPSFERLSRVFRTKKHETPNDSTLLEKGIGERGRITIFSLCHRKVQLTQRSIRYQFNVIAINCEGEICESLHTWSLTALIRTLRTRAAIAAIASQLMSVSETSFFAGQQI